MVNKIIRATYTETYDLNTINNEMSILAIHTPQAPALKRMFKGFYEQYRKMKVLGCSLRMVCASQQKLDPTQVGFGEAQMAPRDVLNPILFKACTGEGVNVLLDQIYNHAQKDNVLEGSLDQHLLTSEDWINAYYSLLADDSWRKEHPQAGLTVLGLKPMVHKVVTTQPFKWNSAVPTNDVGGRPSIGNASGAPIDTSASATGFGAQSGSDNSGEDPVNASVFVSNGLTDMPWLDTAYSTVATFKDPTDPSKTQDRKTYVLQTNIPRIYMGCIVLPPSENLNLYFRAQIQWDILFKDFRPAQDLLPLNRGDYSIGPDDGTASFNYHDDTYFNMYHTATKLDRDVGSFDTAGVSEIEIISEKVR